MDLDEPILPLNAERLSKYLLALRQARRNRNALKRTSPTQRILLKPDERRKIFEKTAGYCHLCGGKIKGRWDADHVIPHSNGGSHSIDNYLAAHSLCNNYRWGYTPEEFQWALKIGVWARLQMEQKSVFGEDLTHRFFEYEIKRIKRRKGNKT